MIDGKNFLYQPVKNDLKAYRSIPKIATGQGDNYTNDCLWDYNYFEKLLWYDSNRFKKPTNTWYSSKSITANQFYCKCRSIRTNGNVFHY